MGSTHIDYKFLFSENGSIQTLFYSLEFVLAGWVGGGFVVGEWVGVSTDYLVAPVVNWTWLRQFYQFIFTKSTFQSFRKFLKTYGPTD